MSTYEQQGAGNKTCTNCGRPGHEHDREKVFPDDGPGGSWHWRYYCP